MAAAYSVFLIYNKSVTLSNSSIIKSNLPKTRQFHLQTKNARSSQYFFSRQQIQKVLNRPCSSCLNWVMHFGRVVNLLVGLSDYSQWARELMFPYSDSKFSAAAFSLACKDNQVKVRKETGKFLVAVNTLPECSTTS